VNIAFLIDNNYSEQLAVTIMSVLKNDKSGNHFHFYVLTDFISQKNKKKILDLKLYKNFEIEFITLDFSVFKSLPTLYHLKTLNYGRILLPSLIKVDKLLFLDCDLIVQDDLTELYNTDFENIFACVVKERLSNENYIIKQISRLGITHYFNAGVMLLNLKKMKNENIQEKCLEFMNNSPEKILLLDQCVLNYAFQDKTKFLDKTYNYQYKIGYSKDLYNTFKNKNGSAKILHFVGKEKPYFGYKHPFENLYYNYLKETSYKLPYTIFKLKMNFLCFSRKVKKIPQIFKLLKYYV